MGRRTQRILPKDATETTALTETLQYEVWGNLWKRTDFAGKTTTFTHDALNRLKTKTADPTHPSLVYSHAIARVEYDHDANGARTAARTYNADGTPLYVESTPRDEHGRIDYKDTLAGRLDYDYYANGLLKDVVSSNTDGVNLGYRYDEINRLAYVDDATNGIPPRTNAYTYNANGSLETVAYANGLAHVYTYDALNRLRGLQVGAVVPNGASLASVLHGYTYNLRASGHRREVVEGAKTTTYTYDDLNRLTGETIANDPHGNNGTVGYTLDKVGNRQNRTSSLSAVPSVLNQTYNARDWLTTDRYDANGNTLNSALLATRYPLLATSSVPDTYDFENRLILRTKPDGTQINVAYDADGLRIQKTLLDASASVTSTTTYLVDTNNLTGYAQVFEERTTSGSPAVTTVKTYTYGSDLISVSSTRSSLLTTRYFVYDGGGSVRELADESGTITDRYDYDAFGLLIHRSGPTDNAYLYRGEQWDEDLGLYYLRARFINPDSGRFWTMDSYEGSNQEPASLHKYLYANANPVTFSDPTGHFSMVELQQALFVTGTLARLAIPTVARIGFSVAQRLVAAALKPLFVFVGTLPMSTQIGQRLSYFDRFLRFFATPTKGHVPVASWLKEGFQKMGISLQQHHVFIQQSWYRAGSPNQWYPGDAAANLGMQRLGNAGFNLMAIPAGLNRALGQSAAGTAAFASATAGSIALAMEEIWTMITGVFEYEPASQQSSNP